LRAAKAAEAIKKFCRCTSAANILDLGSSDGLGILEIAQRLPDFQCTGVEYSQELINSCPCLPSNVRIIRGDATNLPLELRRGSFDAVTIIGSLGYLSDPMAALREARSVLRQKGIAVITFPIVFWNKISLWLGFLSQEHRYTTKIKKRELIRMIEEAGMKVISFRRFMCLPFTALPYFKLAMPLGLVLSIEKAVGRIKIFDWLFVNQIIVAEKP